MSDLKKKTVLLIISVVLLISTLVYMSFAWYTKMTSMAGLTFKTAKWDISANHQIDNFSVNVYEYSTIGEYQYAAPGVWGIIPITVSASYANSDVGYTLTVDKSTMSKEFQQRVYFYYYTGTDTVNHPAKIPSMDDLKELVYGGANPTVLEGTVEYGKTGTSVIYWHWIYDYDEWLTMNDEDLKEVTDILNALYNDSPANLQVLYDVDETGLALNAGSTVPYQTYYYYSDTALYEEYDNSKWPTEVFRPTLYENMGTVDAPKYEERHPDVETLEGTYYIKTKYLQYDRDRDGIQTVYVKDGTSYVETEFRYETERFSRKTAGGETQYYALSTEEINALKEYRKACCEDNDKSKYYGKNDNFFKLLYKDYNTTKDEFDSYDTAVGRQPILYASKMSANVILTGEQVTPSQE